MLDTHRIRARIKEIRKRSTLLDKYFKGLAQEMFLKDDRLNAEAERHLQIAIQACIDIANHLVASLGLDRPVKETAEVFDSLAKEDIIPPSFVPTMKRMTGYRNILIHEYVNIDRNITYTNIQKRLPDLSKFAQHIEKFLRKQPPEVSGKHYRT